MVEDKKEMEKNIEEKGLTVKKKNFSEWYQQVILKSGLADYSPVSGCIIFKPYSYAIWEIMQKTVDERLKKSGVKNAYFPLFIPEKLLRKETEHIKGFEPEVAWVTHAGESKLKERLAIRPTSETIMYEAIAKWIRSWRDLPLRLNQWNNVVRWEFKHPFPFIRGREFLWNEGHSAFATKEEAEKEIWEIMNIYEDICKNYLALHGLLGKKTESEKFAGAVYTVTLEFLLPNGKAVQGPDAHFDGNNFAKAFDIKFLDKDGKERYVWQNTWAITTRMIGVMIAIHGDDKGLVLPPRIAPYQLVIIPIIFKEKEKRVLEKAREIAKILKKFRVVLDDRREYTAGWKFNEYELKGVPLRIEIGPKDIDKEQLVLVRRDTNEKKIIKEKEILKEVEIMLKEIQKNLYEKAKRFIENRIVKVKEFSELEKSIREGNIALIEWCGSAECEEKVKAKLAAKTLNMPIKQNPKGSCIVCKAKAKFEVYVGKSY